MDFCFRLNIWTMQMLTSLKHIKIVWSNKIIHLITYFALKINLIVCVNFNGFSKEQQKIWTELFRDIKGLCLVLKPLHESFRTKQINVKKTFDITLGKRWAFGVNIWKIMITFYFYYFLFKICILLARKVCVCGMFGEYCSHWVNKPEFMSKIARFMRSPHRLLWFICLSNRFASKRTYCEEQ